MKECCRADLSACASLRRLWWCENAPTEKPRARDQWSSCRARTRCFPDQQQTRHPHKGASPRRSRRWQNHGKSASRVSRWHRPDCCARRDRECRDGKVWTRARASKLRCHAGSRGRSIARRPCTDIDPDGRTFLWGSSTGNARRGDEMCATEENPSVARKQVCRRTLGITKAEKPQSPKSKFKSVTPKKSFFLFATSDLPPAINKIAGQQWFLAYFLWHAYPLLKPSLATESIWGDRLRRPKPHGRQDLMQMYQWASCSP